MEGPISRFKLVSEFILKSQFLFDWLAAFKSVLRRKLTRINIRRKLPRTTLHLPLCPFLSFFLSFLSWYYMCLRLPARTLHVQFRSRQGITSLWQIRGRRRVSDHRHRRRYRLHSLSAQVNALAVGGRSPSPSSPLQLCVCVEPLAS